MKKTEDIISYYFPKLNKEEVLSKDELNEKKEIIGLYKSVVTLPLIPSYYIETTFNILKNDAIDLGGNSKKFIIYYFEETYFKKYLLYSYNYFNLFEDKTINACEPVNHALKSYFITKPDFHKLLQALRFNDNLFHININSSNPKIN